MTSSAVAMLTIIVSLFLASPAWAASEDIVYMTDGRELHGQIVSETPQAVVFDYMNKDLGISVTMTLPKAAILKIDRDVPMADTSEEKDTTPEAETPASSGAKTQKLARPSVSRARDGLSEHSEDATFYIVTMNGEVGTDIRSNVYEEVIEEIKAEHPDVVIIKLDSKMIGDTMLDYWTTYDMDWDTYEPDPFKQRQTIQSLMEDELELVKMFKHELPKDIRQVVWVQDATGSSALLALAWSEMYMTSDADLGSLGEIWSMTQFPDEDVRSKMEKAWFGTAKGIMQFGGHSDSFMEGMLRPFIAFSFSCRGRQPVWYIGDDSVRGDLPIQTDGIGYSSEIRRWVTQLVGQSGKKQGEIHHGWEFSSRICEDFLISDGTAENLEDLALLMDFRRYRVLESEALNKVAEYKEEWRTKFDRTWESFEDYYKYMRRAGENYQLENLQKAKKALGRVIAGVRTNESVALQFKSRTGMDRIYLENEMEKLKSRIRQLTRGGGGGGGGRGGGAGPAGGGSRP